MRNVSMKAQLRFGTALLGGGLGMSTLANALLHVGEVVPWPLSLSAFVAAAVGFSMVAELAWQACRENERPAESVAHRGVSVRGIITQERQ